MTQRFRFTHFAALSGALALGACGESSPTPTDAQTTSDRTDATPDVSPDVSPDALPDVSPDVPVDTSPDVVGDVAPDVDTRPRQTVRFALAPSWPGVTAVEVFGSFGRSDDWTRPFATATRDGDTWRATGELPPGTYSYVFRVVGDAACGARAATCERLVHDPRNLRSGLCATGSSVSMADPRAPCAILFVPQSKTPQTTYTVSGAATVGAAPAGGWLAVLERAEPSQSAFFVDRMTMAADGRFTFRVSSGQYRVALWHPTMLSDADSSAAPLAMNFARRAVSTPFYLSADATLPPVDVTYAGYAAHMPRGMASLPVTFTFAAPAMGNARASVYAAANSNDAWWESDWASASTATWDGAFNTPATTETRAATGTTYGWSSWVQLPMTAGAPARWTLQGAVLPLTLR